MLKTMHAGYLAEHPADFSCHIDNFHDYWLITNTLREYWRCIREGCVSNILFVSLKHNPIVYEWPVKRPVIPGSAWREYNAAHGSQLTYSYIYGKLFKKASD
mgnify:CR=1 FL=1